MTATESSPAIPTKDALLIAAKRVFAMKGYAGATVKEIADEAGVNVSLVSYHFNGKENLFRECLEAYGKRRLHATEQFLKSPQSAEDFRVRFTLFLEDYFQNAVDDQDTMMIMNRECMSANPLTQDLFENFFLKSFENIKVFFGDAAAKGFLFADADAHYVTIVIMGTLVHGIQMNPMHEQIYNCGLKDPTHREKMVKTIVQLVTGGTQS